MAELYAKTALRHDQARAVTIGRLEIRDNPDLSITWIARRRGSDLAAVEDFLGMKLPAAGDTSIAGTCRALPSAREQWLVLSPWSANFPDQVKAAGGAGISVCDQSDGWVVFEILGDTIDPLLERLCDLDPMQLTPERSAPSSVEHLRVILMRLPEGLMILGPRSSAQSLHHAIIRTAQAIA